MKKVILITAVLALGLAVNVFAAADKAKSAPPVTPVVSATDTSKQEVKTIFSYKKDLGLTDKQEADIKKIITDLQNTFTEKGKKLLGLRQELGQMLKDRANLNIIRKKIEEMGRIQMDNTYMDIESSRKIENILNFQQLTKWQNIQKESREKLQAEIAARAKSEPGATTKPKK